MKVLLVFLAALAARAAIASPITSEGEKLAAFLDSMHVEEHWRAGAIVEWRTGEPTGKPITDSGKHTHCSQFAAAACDRAGVYLLRPPDRRATLLANAQFDWLAGEGREKGWTLVPSASAAQALANRGALVVAVCKNRDPLKSGHIALLRPDAKSEEAIEAKGPQVIQAGGINRKSTTLREGFANHPGAFEHGEISYYAHAFGGKGGVGGEGREP